MNRVLLQIFLLLAVIPIMLVIGWGFLILGPIICFGFAMNAYRYNNEKELYFWLIIGVIAFIVSLFVLGIFYKTLQCHLQGHQAYLGEHHLDGNKQNEALTLKLAHKIPSKTLVLQIPIRMALKLQHLTLELLHLNYDLKFSRFHKTSL